MAITEALSENGRGLGPWPPPQHFKVEMAQCPDRVDVEQGDKEAAEAPGMRHHSGDA